MPPPFSFRHLWLAVLLAVSARGAAQTPPVLEQIAEIRALSREEAAQARPVRVRGVVTLKLGGGTSFIVQDGEAGISVNVFAARDLKVWAGGELPPSESEPGAVVEVEGVSGPGGYAPVIVPVRFRRQGTAPLPAARRLTMEEVLAGSADSSRVELEGVVQGTIPRSADRAGGLKIKVEGHLCEVDYEDAQGADPGRLVDARVRVAGVLFPIYNFRSEFTRARITATSLGQVEVLKPPPDDPFQATRVTLKRLLPFSPTPDRYHRKVTQGVVTFCAPRQFFFLQEGNTGVRVESPTADVQVGDQVEVAGFVDSSRMIATLIGALARRHGAAPVPAAEAVTVAQLFQPQFATPWETFAEVDYFGALVRLRGLLRQTEWREEEGLFTALIESDGRLFRAFLPVAGRPRGAAAGPWTEGAEVEVTGVCELEFRPGVERTRSPTVSGFSLWLRTPADVRVVRAPAWWTPLRLSIALGGTALVLFLALGWNLVLQRLLQRRTARLEEVMRAHRDVELEYASARRERLRLAVDLHDGMKQLLTAAAFRLEAAAGHLPAAPDAAAGQLAAAHRALSRTQTELEECLWGLHAVAEGPPDFVSLLRHVTASVEHWPEGVVAITSAGTPRRLPRHVAGSLLLLFQEAIGNALRHGAASHVTVTVDYGAEALELRIVDDGCGFDPGSAPGPRAGHFGIAGMRQRMAWLHGTLQLDRPAGGGMEVRARLPWSALEESGLVEQRLAAAGPAEDAADAP